MDYGDGDDQTADQGCVWLFGCRSKSVGAGLAYSCTPAPSVTQKRRCSYGVGLVALYMCDICLSLWACIYHFCYWQSCFVVWSLRVQTSLTADKSNADPQHEERCRQYSQLVGTCSAVSVSAACWKW